MSKRFAGATERNRDPILGVLRQVLPPEGTVLEIASGTGQHTAYFAAALPSLVWQATDVSPEALSSIGAWLEDASLDNALPPLMLDARLVPWPLDRVDAVLCVNMIHISPWETTVGLFRGASSVLDTGAPLITYGPYRVHGQHTAPSNEAFDARLRSDNPEWGVRDLDDLVALGSQHGFQLDRTVPMPANNLTLVWTRSEVSP